MDGNKPGKFSKPGKFKRFFRTVVIVLVLLSGFLVYWFYINPYSKGYRTGILVKISQKGNVFKTHEGELWESCRQMANAERFYFSVTNDSIAGVLAGLQDECVQLTYIYYRARLPWRGDSKYVVTEVRRQEAVGQ